MTNEPYFSFAVALLKKINVSCYFIEDPQNISGEIDAGLRAMLFGENNYSKLLLNSPTEAKERVIYRFFDEYRCN